MFKLQFKTDNAAFSDEMMHPEIARILRELAIVIENGQKDSGKVRDVNGNTVGQWSIGR